MALNVNALINQLVFNYVTCNYSTNVVEKVNTIGDTVFDAHWYKFPALEQKFMSLVIQRTQKSVQLTGFGIITCSKSTYLLVCLLRNQSIYSHSILSILIFYYSFLNLQCHTLWCSVNLVRRRRLAENFSIIINRFDQARKNCIPRFIDHKIKKNYFHVSAVS